MVDLNKLYENYLILFFEVNYKNTSFISDKKHDYDQIYEYINYFWQAKYGNKLDISKEENKYDEYYITAKSLTNLIVNLIYIKQ